MATTIATSSSWFYDKSSEVLFVNEDTHKVGINNNAPQYELQVDGNIYATGYCNLPAFALSNQIYPIATYSSNTSYWGSNVAAWSSNNLVKNSNVVGVSNLATSNVNLVTLQRNGSNVIGTDAKIDYNTWIKNGPTYSNDNTLAIAGITLGALGVIGATGQILSSTGAGQVLIDDLKNRVGNNEIDDTYDPDQAASENLKTHWNNVIFKPIYQNIGKKEVGFGSNIYIARNSSIYTIDPNNLIDYDSGRTRRINTASTGLTTIFDGVTSTLVSRYILCSSNASIGNILTAPTILTSNISTSNITSSNASFCNCYASNANAQNFFSSNASAEKFLSSSVQVGNFFVTSSGIYVGDPINPLTSFLVIDNAGNYKGTIAKEQINNQEAMNLNTLCDGVIQYGGFQTATNPLFDSPFKFDYNALFEVL